MGDISEFRGIIVAATFVAIFVWLVSQMMLGSPDVFLAQDPGASNLPDISNPTSLLLWNVSTNKTLNFETAIQVFDLNGWSMSLGPTILPQGVFLAFHNSYIWGLIQGESDFFEWYETNNTKVSVISTTVLPAGATFPVLPTSVMDADFLTPNRTQRYMEYVVANGKTKINVRIAFNETLYSKPSIAFLADGLTLFFNQDLSDRNTSINIIGFILGIFTFSIPGVPFYISIFISTPIIAALSYLIFIFVLRMIGSVFGGGGA